MIPSTNNRSPTMSTLTHNSCLAVHDSGVLANITSYDHLWEACIAFGNRDGVADDDRANQKGMLFEVFAEFFINVFGDAIGVHNLRNTSDDQYHYGTDFYGSNPNGDALLIQVKAYDVGHKLSRKDLITFIDRADELDIPKARRILFTSTVSEGEHGVFELGWGVGRMVVIDRRRQQQLIDTAAGFWQRLRDAVATSAPVAGVTYTKAPTMYPSQRKLFDAYSTIAAVADPHQTMRMRLIMTTGGGKTLVEYNIADHCWHAQNRSSVVMVAPTLELIAQHQETFQSWGALTGKTLIEFRTGEETDKRGDASYDCVRTTNAVEFITEFTKAAAGGGKVMIFVTYASLKKMCDALRSSGNMVDLMLCDEAHNLCTQTIEQRDHLLSIPACQFVAVSASQKRGGVVSMLDERLFGPLGAIVGYRELVTEGRLCGKIVLKIVEASSLRRIQAISNDVRLAAEAAGIDPDKAEKEAAVALRVMEDMATFQPYANVITFSERVDICKTLVQNSHAFDEIVVNTVHAGTPKVDRKRIKEIHKQADRALLFQHSVYKEGQDLPKANAVILHRNMDLIGFQQAVGRILRAHTNKEAAVVYFVIDGRPDEDTYVSLLQDILTKMQGAGFEDGDWDIAGIVDQRVGVVENDDGQIREGHFEMTLGNLQAKLRQITIRIQQENADLEILARIREAPTVEAALQLIFAD